MAANCAFPSKKKCLHEKITYFTRKRLQEAAMKSCANDLYVRLSERPRKCIFDHLTLHIWYYLYSAHLCFCSCVSQTLLLGWWAKSYVKHDAETVFYQSSRYREESCNGMFPLRLSLTIFCWEIFDYNRPFLSVRKKICIIARNGGPQALMW